MSKLEKDIAYIKGKLDSSEKYAQEHREWEMDQISSIRDSLDNQNNRLRKTEVQLGWLKGFGAMVSVIIGYIFKRTL